MPVCKGQGNRGHAEHFSAAYVTCLCGPDFTSLLVPCWDLLCLAGSDCKPCLREFPDRSTLPLESHNPKSFLPSLTAEDDAFCTSMAEEKASVPFPSATTVQGTANRMVTPYSEGSVVE